MSISTFANIFCGESKQTRVIFTRLKRELQVDENKNLTNKK